MKQLIENGESGQVISDGQCEGKRGAAERAPLTSEQWRQHALQFKAWWGRHGDFEQ